MKKLLLLLIVLPLFSYSQAKSIINGGLYTEPAEPTFYLDANGVTIKCSNCAAGDTGRVDGVLYEAVDRALLIQRRDEGADFQRFARVRLLICLKYFKTEVHLMKT